LAAVLLVGGCNRGPGTVTATGTVLEKGKPIVLSSTGVVQVTLIPDVLPGTEFTSYVGRCDEEGNFEVIDVPAGTYRIGIEVLDPTPQVDKLGGAFSMNNTKITREVDGKTPLTIDLAEPGT
jgi:hypothetical protein